jgi:AcrR family transcriptional regulator
MFAAKHPVTPSTRVIQIIEIAQELFSQDGYDRVTIKQIAARCEISEPAVYRYFASKEALFDAVLESLISNWNYQDLSRQIEQERDVEQILQSLATHILNNYCESEKSCRLLLFAALAEKPKAHSVYQAIRGRYVRYLAEQLDRLYRAGLIRQVNNKITARCFVGMVFECAMGFSLWKEMQGDYFPAEEVVANNVPIYAKGLTSTYRSLK